jgi:hypothetical protein
MPRPPPAIEMLAFSLICRALPINSPTACHRKIGQVC